MTQAFETTGFRTLFRIPCLERKTSDCLQSKVNLLVGLQESLLAAAKRRKLAWFGQVTIHDSIFKTSFRAP